MKSKYLVLSLAVVVSAFAAGCTSTGDDYKKGVPLSALDHPVLGQLATPQIALLGPDANNNGIRDELDLSIATTYKAVAPKAAQFALQLTQAMVDGSRGTPLTAAKKASLTGAAACLDAAHPGASSAITSQTLSTPERKAAMARWDAAAKLLPATAGGCAA